MDAAETKWPRVLTVIFDSVPPTLWRLTRRTGSLLPEDKRLRSPGSAFVEEGGAEGALAQGMLCIVLRIVRLGCERGLLGVQGGSDTDIDGNKGDKDEERRHGAGLVSMARLGQSRIGTPWTSAIEALVATVAGGCSSNEGESRLGLAGRLVRVFCDQDDALVDMLLVNMRIFHKLRYPVSITLIAKMLSR